MKTSQTSSIRARNPEGLPEPKAADWIVKFLGTRQPLGFEAGDANLYRYVANCPVNYLDPSGEQSGVRNHSYPLHLGGSASQPVIEFQTQAQHQAFHKYLASRGFPMNGGNAGRMRWSLLNRRQQQAIIIRALRAAGVPNNVIQQNIAAIMRNANPGRLIPRPSGFPGGIILVPAIMAIIEVLTNPVTAGRPNMIRHGEVARTLTHGLGACSYMK